MGRTPKLNAEQKRQARERRAQGESFGSIAASFGVDESSVRRAVPKAQQETPPYVPSPALGRVEPPATGQGPQPAPGPAQDAHARAKAAAAGQDVPASGSTPGAILPVPPPTPEQAARMLVMMCEMALRVGTKIYAAKLKVRLTPDMVSGLAMTETEKADLMVYAPWAAPFLNEMLVKYGKYVGPAIFGLVFYDMTISRFAVLKDIKTHQAVQEAASSPAKPPTPAVGVPTAPEVVPAGQEGVDAKPVAFKVIG